ncbi:MAG TPA: hypothetical protein VLS90_00660, partial [Thermodesulfobacteriota bacterium]|nr:hypothetical protein [Thermodesulfobacteriota bacterium]
SGPCRINPFGDEPARGTCGADRDQIVMENLFSATLEGVLETRRSFGGSEEIPDIAPDLPSPTRDKLSRAGILPVRLTQILGAKNSYFSHKGYLSQTLGDLTRLGLIHYGLLKQSGAAAEPRAGNFEAGSANILVAGEAPSSFFKSLGEAATRTAGKVNVVPAASAGQGASELALGMNVDAVVILQGSLQPGLEQLAAKLEIPVILWDESSASQNSARTVAQALLHSREGSYLTRQKISARPGGAADRLWERGKEAAEALRKGRFKGIVAVLGEPAVKETFLERTLALIQGSLERNFFVIVGGELAALEGRIEKELAQRLESKFLAQSEGLSPLSFWGCDEIPRFVSFLRGAAPEKGFHEIPAAVSFTEFYRLSTWAKAVSLLSLGFAVQIGARLPFWGSPEMTQVITRDWPAISGGTLLAGPVVPDGASQAGELASVVASRGK